MGNSPSSSSTVELPVAPNSWHRAPSRRPRPATNGGPSTEHTQVLLANPPTPPCARARVHTPHHCGCTPGAFRHCSHHPDLPFLALDAPPRAAASPQSNIFSCFGECWGEEIGDESDSRVTPDGVRKVNRILMQKSAPARVQTGSTDDEDSMRRDSRDSRDNLDSMRVAIRPYKPWLRPVELAKQEGAPPPPPPLGSPEVTADAPSFARSNLPPPEKKVAASAKERAGAARRKHRSRSSSSSQPETLGLQVGCVHLFALKSTPSLSPVPPLLPPSPLTPPTPHQDELEQMSVSELMRLMQAYNIPLPPSTYSTLQPGEMVSAIMDSGKVSYPANLGESEVLVACSVPAAYDGDDGDELMRQVRGRAWPMLPGDEQGRLCVWFTNCTAPVTPMACAVFYVVYRKEAQRAKERSCVPPLPGEKLSSSISPSSSYLLARVTEEKERERETAIPPMISEAEISASCAVPSGYALDNGPELLEQVRAGLYPDLTAAGTGTSVAWFGRSKQPDASAYWYHVYSRAHSDDSEEKQGAADARFEEKPLHHRNSLRAVAM